MNTIKKILKISGISVAILVGLIFILLLIIPFFVKEKTGDIVKMVAKEYVSVTVDFSDLDISLLKHFPNASISIEDM